MGSDPAERFERDFLPNLDALRGLAALWVVGFHLRFELRSLLGSGYAVLWPWIRGGRYGVDLFFALSGFLIAHRYVDSISARWHTAAPKFVWRRFLRIWPAYIVALGLAWGIHMFGVSMEYRIPPGKFDVAHLLTSAAMVQGWTFPIPRTWNVVGWSVSVEWALYLGFALLMAASVARRRTFVLVAMVGTIGLLTTIAKPSPMEHGLARGLLGFGAGILASEVSSRLHQRRTNTLLGIALLVSFGVLYAYTRGSWVHPLYWVGPFFGVSIALLATGPQLRATSLACTIGRSSYSLYLCHGSVILLARIIWEVPMSHRMGSGSALLSLGTAIALTPLATVVLYRFVERRWYQRAERFPD